MHGKASVTIHLFRVTPSVFTIGGATAATGITPDPLAGTATLGVGGGLVPNSRASFLNPIRSRDHSTGKPNILTVSRPRLPSIGSSASAAPSAAHQRHTRKSQ